MVDDARSSPNMAALGTEAVEASRYCLVGLVVDGVIKYDVGFEKGALCEGIPMGFNKPSDIEGWFIGNVSGIPSSALLAGERCS